MRKFSHIFSHTTLNKVLNFISNESIKYNDEHPPWFNSKIKCLIQEKTMRGSYIEMRKVGLALEKG